MAAMLWEDQSPAGSVRLGESAKHIHESIEDYLGLKVGGEGDQIEWILHNSILRRQFCRIRTAAPVVPGRRAG
jgi:hypothetical protein